jgi:hypothetical protein
MQIKKGITGAYGIKDSYEFYKSYCEEPIDYKTYSNLIKECNKKLTEIIVNDCDAVELPYRLGAIHIAKYERNYDPDKNKWAVDFKKTKESGFVVYFDQKWTYRWRWKKHYSIVKNKTKYKFTASRYAKRLVPKAIANKKDYINI